MTEQDFSPFDLDKVVEPATVGDKPHEQESPVTAAVGDQVTVSEIAGVADRASDISFVAEDSSPKGDSGTVSFGDSKSVNQTGEAKRSEAESSFIPFYSVKPYGSKVELKREQPHHRLFCIMLAQGFTPVEIAEQTGYDEWTIKNTKKQDWAQKLIAELQQTQGERAIKNILSGAAAEVARKMCDTALGKTEAAPAVQLNAQKEVLNRLFGTAPQHIKHEQVAAEDLSTEELKKLIKQN